MSNQPLEIPISKAEEIANMLHYDEVIIVGANYEHGLQHVTTFGKTLDASNNAAAGGNAIKRLLKWPEDQCNAVSEKQKLQDIADINEAIKKVDSNMVSDGYHTFGELYKHRIQLFIALCYYNFCHEFADDGGSNVWKSKTHSDGSTWDGWFILGINENPGRQITYHLPIDKWDECEFAQELDKAPEYDGHTSQDVLDRLKTCI